MPTLTDSAWTLAATCCAFDAGLMDFLDRPRTIDETCTHAEHLPRPLVVALVDVLVAAGSLTRAGDTVRVSATSEAIVRSPFRATRVADMKSALLQSRLLLNAAEPRRRPYVPWQHRQRDVLETQGAGGEMMAELISTSLAPALTGLAAALVTPGARFLDVGAGVGRIAIAMAQRWPSLHVVGLEPWRPSLRLAERSVAAAGLGERVEMRVTRVEALREFDAFDLVWMPSPFIPPRVIAEALLRSRASLRANGWIVVGINGVDDEEDDDALTRLTTATWGGCSLGPATATRLLHCAGFADVRVLTLAQGPTVAVGRR